MDDKEELFLQLSKEALYNSRLWLEEANHLLFERQSYGHSLSLSLYSIEESVKSWICYSVGIGILESTHDIVKEVFKSHPSKMESVIYFSMFWNIPLVQKSHLEELNEEEKSYLRNMMTEIEQPYRNAVKRLDELRKRGIYVDVLEGKILSPKIITRKEAEDMFLDAFGFNKLVGMFLNMYENASEDERREYLERAKRSTQIGLDNWTKIVYHEEGVRLV